MRAPITSGRRASGSQAAPNHSETRARARSRAPSVPSARRSRSQVKPCAVARNRAGPELSDQSPGFIERTPTAVLQLALQQTGAARRIARPGIAHRQRGRVRQPAHPQARQFRHRETGVTQPAATAHRGSPGGSVRKVAIAAA